MWGPFEGPQCTLNWTNLWQAVWYCIPYVSLRVGYQLPHLAIFAPSNRKWRLINPLLKMWCGSSLLKGIPTQLLDQDFSKRAPRGYVLYIEDYTTQSCGDYSKLIIYGALLDNQENSMESLFLSWLKLLRSESPCRDPGSPKLVPMVIGTSMTSAFRRWWRLYTPISQSSPKSSSDVQTEPGFLGNSQSCKLMIWSNSRDLLPQYEIESPNGVDGLLWWIPRDPRVFPMISGYCVGRFGLFGVPADPGDAVNQPGCLTWWFLATKPFPYPIGSMGMVYLIIFSYVLAKCR